MKILFVDQSDHAIPPPSTVIRADTYISVPLAESLQERGHDVTFLCPQGSKVNTKKVFTSSGPLVSVIPLDKFNAISNPQVRTELLWTFYTDMYLKLIETVQKESYDLIHYHTNIPMPELAVLLRISIPCVFTLHSVTRTKDAENKVMELFNKRSNNYFVSISDYQHYSFPNLSFIKTIYHGLQVKNINFVEETNGSLLFAGRLKKVKGLKEAVEVAVRTKQQLKIIGATSYDDQIFFTDEIDPLIESHLDLIEYSNVIDRNKIFEFYAQAKAVLVPILWEEPFGLVMIESMATGTPIIAFARGSVPEIIEDGETGFIVNSSDQDIRGDWIIKKTGIEGLCEAVERIYSMPEEQYKQMRKNCRRHVEKHFTIEKMVDGYEEVYRKILSKKA